MGFEMRFVRQEGSEVYLGLKLRQLVLVPYYLLHLLLRYIAITLQLTAENHDPRLHTLMVSSL